MRGQRPLRAVAAASEMRARRRRLTTIGAAIALAMMLVALSHQYAKTYTLAREAARLEQRRRDLIADNARLRDEIERLQTDDRYIEEIARRQLGLVRPGEIELLIVPYDGTVAAPGSAPQRLPGRAPRPAAGPAMGTVTGAAPATGPSPQEDPRHDTMVRPHRGIAEWAIAVRDAVRRLLYHRPPH